MGTKNLSDDFKKSDQINNLKEDSFEQATSLFAGFNLLLQNSPAASFIAEPEGKILIANTSACNLFGYTAKEFCELNYQSLFQDGQDFFSGKTFPLKNQSCRWKCLLHL